MITIEAIVAASGAIQKGSPASAVIAVQFALRQAGQELIADGDFGRITQTAVERFQASHNLTPMGFVGPKTAAALDHLTPAELVAPKPPAPLASVLKTRPWLSVARALTGTKEFPGAGDNPIIIGWAREIATTYPQLHADLDWYRHDSVAWCGLAQGICMTRAGIEPPSGLLGAGNWADWGQRLTFDKRTPGTIMVYARVGGHHVTQYESEDGTYYYCRGGNQSDQFNVTRIPIARSVLAMRWPKGFDLPTTGPVRGRTANSVMIGGEA